ncbi:MAG: ATP-binding protein [Myxococcota bacterium]|nr:ATP-binding protein [Myxococcota bacterium]
MWMVERLAGLYDTFPDCVLALDHHEHILYCNDSFSTLIGTEKEALLGRTFSSLVHPMNLYSQLGIRKSLTNGLVSDLRLTLLTSQEKPVTLSMSISEITDPDSSLAPGFLISARDDSIVQEHMEKEAKYMAQELEQKEALANANKDLARLHAELAYTAKLEKEHANELLSQATRLATLGELIGSIGHEINTPLMLLKMNNEFQTSYLSELRDLLMPIFGSDPEAQAFKSELNNRFGTIFELFNTSEVANKRLQDLSIALRNRARIDAIAEPVPINDVVLESLTISMGKLKPYDLHRNLDEHAGIVTCRQSQIGQVVTNLLSNAADAVADAKRSKGGDYIPTIAIHTLARPRLGQNGVCISVSDNGNGISDEDRAKIFDRYFTTKPTGKGTGLGLSLISTIVGAHGGTIDVINDPSLGGARFEVWLPRDPSALLSA